MSVESLLVPADALRRRLLRGLGPLTAPLMQQRELRVAVAGTVLVLVSAILTLGCPLWLLAWGPILYGVPHLLADVRYLVVRPGYHRRPGLWLLAAPLLLAAAVGAGAHLGLLAVAGALLCARGDRLLRGVALALMLVLAVLAYRAGAIAALVLAHLHNFIAVALWWGWRRRTDARHRVPLVLFAAATILLLLAPLPVPSGPGLHYHIAWLAPGVAAPLATRLVLCFAFAQAVHYGIWVRLIPEEDRPRRTPRTFAASVRALRADLGALPLLLTVAAAAGLAVWAVWDLTAARASYFRMALFHGPLELCAAALFLIEGRPR